MRVHVVADDTANDAELMRAEIPKRRSICFVPTATSDCAGCVLILSEHRALRLGEPALAGEERLNIAAATASARHRPNSPTSKTTMNATGNINVRRNDAILAATIHTRTDPCDSPDPARSWPSSSSSESRKAALATSFSTDQSDLWYVPTESGWGMQLVQRDTVIFATLFVYDMNNKPTWFVATLTYQGNLAWSGDLLATTGPWFGAVPFDASTVVVRKVGTMSWTAQTSNVGTTSYSVDGVNVSKSIVRQSLAAEDYSGHYAGATHLATTGCVDPTRDVVTEDIGVFYVAQVAQTVTLTSFPLKGGSCSLRRHALAGGADGRVRRELSLQQRRGWIVRHFRNAGQPLRVQRTHDVAKRPTFRRARPPAGSAERG